MRETWITALSATDAVTAIAVSEPGVGSNVAGIEIRAGRDDDECVVDGRKRFVRNAMVADVVPLLAKTDPRAGARGLPREGAHYSGIL